MTACDPPKRVLCPEEINRLGALGVQIEALNSQNGVYRPRTREQELFFRHFCGLTPHFIELLRRRPFFFVSLHLRIREKSQKF